jgi:DNA-directed RNA polymerase I, II, and III subunit RPABC1
VLKLLLRLLTILEEKAIKRGIIVFPGNMTPSARKVSSETSFEHCRTSDYLIIQTKVIVAMAQQYKLEEFSESDLLVNITHHALVPKHEVLTAEGKKVLLEK